MSKYLANVYFHQITPGLLLLLADSRGVTHTHTIPVIQTEESYNFQITLLTTFSNHLQSVKFGVRAEINATLLFLKGRKCIRMNAQKGLRPPPPDQNQSHHFLLNVMKCG